MRQACRQVFSAALILAFFSLISCSYNANGLDFQSARTLSMAQAGRAGALLTDVVTLNPSILGFYELAGVSGSLFWFNPKKGGGLFNVTAIDGVNPLFSAGASFTRRYDLDFIHLGVAKKVMPWLSVGAHGKRLASRTNNPQPDSDSLTAYDGGVSATFILGNRLVPFPLVVAVTSDNLHNAEKYHKYTGGKQYALSAKTSIIDTLIIYADYVQKHLHSGSYPNYHGAVELALGEGFFARTGLMGTHNKGIAFGGGWVGPKVGVHYGYQKQTAPDTLVSHAITLDLYM